MSEAEAASRSKLCPEDRHRLALAAVHTRPDLTGLTEKQTATAQIKWVAEWAGRPLPPNGDRADWWKQAKAHHSKLVKAARRGVPPLSLAESTFAVQLSASLALTADERAHKRQCVAEQLAVQKRAEKAAQAERKHAAHADRVARVVKDGVTLYGADLCERQPRSVARPFSRPPRGIALTLHLHLGTGTVSTGTDSTARHHAQGASTRDGSTETKSTRWPTRAVARIRLMIPRREAITSM